MPIRPEMKDRYPPDWPQISDYIRFTRAQGRCECDGRCGRPADHLDVDNRCRNHHAGAAYKTGSRVVLTTAHLEHDPAKCADQDLMAMCNGCHLNYDREHHAQTRAKTRAAAIAAAGQGSLLDGTLDDAG